ncbi:hypothetical protein BDY24DRAFT_438695 [Mrakia frigida]|uniref:uncharacterized protein n=1 Tax=Mrakia frigida TaxID=29902 RepID=UPI003FCC0F44
MSASTTHSVHLASKPPPLLRTPTEIILQIFQSSRPSDQISLSSTCSLLREIGVSEIFRHLYLGTRKDRTFDSFRALASSPLRVHVRSLGSYVYDGPQEPLDLWIVDLALDSFPNLSALQCDVTVESFLRIYHTSRIEFIFLDYLECMAFIKVWRETNESHGLLPRREVPLSLGSRFSPTSFHLETSNQGSSNWDVLGHVSEDAIKLDWFLSSILASNLVFPHLQISGNASAPIPSSSFLCTTKLPSLRAFTLRGIGEPSAEFLKSAGAVACVQSPSSLFSIRLLQPHDLASSLGILGGISPFGQLEGVEGWGDLGRGTFSVEFDARNWTVSSLDLSSSRRNSTSLLPSLGSALRNLSSLTLSSPEDNLSWPKDWNSVVESFKSFPSLTSLRLYGSLTPYSTDDNAIACCDESFDSLADSHPILHRQSILVGGYWNAWKRFGLLLNLFRLRRLGPSLPEGCTVFRAGRLGLWSGKVVVVEGVGGRTIKGVVGELDRDLDEGTDDTWRAQVDTEEGCGDGWREGWGGELVPWTCFACGEEEEEEMNLLESATECGKEEFEKALNGEWKTTWTESDVKLEYELAQRSLDASNSTSA